MASRGKTAMTALTSVGRASAMNFSMTDMTDYHKAIVSDLYSNAKGTANNGLKEIYSQYDKLLTGGTGLVIVTSDEKMFVFGHDLDTIMDQNVYKQLIALGRCRKDSTTQRSILKKLGDNWDNFGKIRVKFLKPDIQEVYHWYIEFKEKQANLQKVSN